jgi:hypothetical protein
MPYGVPSCPTVFRLQVRRRLHAKPTRSVNKIRFYFWNEPWNNTIIESRMNITYMVQALNDIWIILLYGGPFKLSTLWWSACAAEPKTKLAECLSCVHCTLLILDAECLQWARLYPEARILRLKYKQHIYVQLLFSAWCELHLFITDTFR